VLWSQLMAHGPTLVGGVVAATLISRYGSDALLRLVAGLVAILARDKRSRSARALDVLRVISGDRNPRHSSDGGLQLGRPLWRLAWNLSLLPGR